MPLKCGVHSSSVTSGRVHRHVHNFAFCAVMHSVHRACTGVHSPCTGACTVLREANVHSVHRGLY